MGWRIPGYPWRSHGAKGLPCVVVADGDSGGGSEGWRISREPSASGQRPHHVLDELGDGLNCGLNRAPLRGGPQSSTGVRCAP